MDKNNLKTKFLSKKIIVLVVIITIFIFYISFNLPPKDFPLNQVLIVESGQSLQQITDSLYENHVIRSPFFFRTYVIILGGEKRVIAGDYLLDQKIGPADLAYRLVRGKFHLEPFKATIPEGWNIFQTGDYLKENLVNFNLAQFLILAKEKEGYLFPDTYFIFPTTKPEGIIKMMEDNFEAKINSLSAFATTTRSKEDIIIMASILENETRTPEDRRIVSGILWKRLKLGMPLQVDASFVYVNGKNTYELTANDLKIDSPYNTYKYQGLPPGPIGNPGLDSILAALNPTTTKYLYFLSSLDGKMYYAQTFEQHKKNRELYLK